MLLLDWLEIIREELEVLLQGFIGFIPKFIGAIIVFLIGWIFAIAIGKLVAEILRKVKFNKVFEKGGWKTSLEKADIKVDVSGFIGAIFKWVLMIVFLVAAVRILGLVQFSDFLTAVLAFLPDVVIAVLIFVVAVIIADIAEKVIRATVESTKVGYGHLAGAIVKWSIWIFAILAILFQLRIAAELIQTIITGVVALIVVAGGIAFGLGGRDAAAGVIENLKRKLQG